MEHLNKQQIVLLCILIAIVTSIATGIVTVSISDQGQNPGVVNTVNQVVEKTIERVISPATTTVIKQTENRTIIVGVEEQTAIAVDKASKAIVRIYDNTSGAEVYAGLGVIMTKEGIVAVDKNELLSTATGKYSIVYPDKTKFTGKVTLDVGSDFAFISPIISDPKNSPAQQIFASANSDTVKLGQNILILAGKDSFMVYPGIVQGVVEDKMSTTTRKVDQIIASQELKRASLASPLVNIGGDVIGIKSFTDMSAETNPFTPINFVEARLASTTIL
ncbi:MAG: S1C family serine protease [bacterium]